MHITMVKKRLSNGEPCAKCAQAQELLERRGLWGRVDETVWALEGDESSPGMQLAAQHGIDLAPFFIVKDANEERTYTSVMRFIKAELAELPPTPAAPGDESLDDAATRLESADPEETLRWGLTRYGADLALAFSGAEDVVLIELATRTGMPFSVFCLDTGRLHPETYRFIDRVRQHYGVEIQLMTK